VATVRKIYGKNVENYSKCCCVVTQSMKEIMVKKTTTSQEEFFFVTTALEFWKIDKLVGRLGDQCLVVSSKTIHRQAIYATKVRTTTKIHLSLLTNLVLQNCSKFLLKNQSNKQNPSPILFSSKKQSYPILS